MYICDVKELKKFNIKTIDEVKKHIEQDAINHIQNELNNTFQGNKFIKLK